MFGVDEFYRDLLEEAKSPEEVKSILAHGFPNVPKDIIDSIVDLDPTKKKSYSRWAVLTFENEGDLLKKCISNGVLKKVFDYFKERNNTGLSLSDIKSLKEAIDYLPDVDPVLIKNGNGGPEDDYDIVYDTENWKIAVPHTYDASKKLGKGCKWCTAEGFGTSPSYFNDYTKNHGPLWINFKMNCPETCPMDNKEYPYTRYQFCFETNDFRDCHDVEIDSFSSIEMPEEVGDFYKKQDDSYGKVIDNDIVNADLNWEEYEDERWNDGVAIKNNTLIVLREYNDNFEFSDNDPYFVYDIDDTNDPISWEIIDVESGDFIINEFEGSDCILLKGVYRNVFCYLVNGAYSSNYEGLGVDGDIQIKGEFVMFLDDTEKSFYMYSLTKSTMKTYFLGVDRACIDEFKVTNGLRIKGSGEIYNESELYIDLITRDKEHVLLKYDSKKDDFISLILYDNPENKDVGFEVAFDSNGKPFITTEAFSYTHESLEVLRNYILATKINSRFCIVSKIRKSRSQDLVYNIFDKLKNKLLFDDDKESIILMDRGCTNYVVVNQNAESFILDLDSMKKFGSNYTRISGCVYREEKFIFCYTQEGGFDFLKYEIKGIQGKAKLTVIGKYDSIFKNYPLYGCFIAKSKTAPSNFNMLSVYDYNGNAIIDKFAISDEYENLIYCISVDTTKGFLFDMESKQVILDNIENVNRRYDYTIFSNNEKSVIYFRSNKNIILCDKIVLSGEGNVGFMVDGKLYFAYVYSGIKMPQTGIDTTQIKKIEGESNGGASIRIITINDTLFDYNAYYGNFDILSGNENAQSEVLRLLGIGGNINEIKSTFNTWFGRINNIKF